MPVLVFALIATATAWYITRREIDFIEKKTRKKKRG
jgi:hypothetical protein